MSSTDSEFFSQSVHKYIAYQDIQETLQKYKRRILSELHLRGLDEDFFKGRVVLDVGTGFQALVVSQMGAKVVFHLDQSRTQVTWMQEYCKTEGIDNISSIECDITKNIPLEDESIEIVLLFGVWHHLLYPSAFIKHLLPKLHVKESHLWFRIYRAGTWSRWLVESLRKLSKKANKQRVEQLLNIRYPHPSANQYKGDAMDDLFAPIWQAFHPMQFYIEDVSSFVNGDDWEYDFSADDENFRVDFHLNETNIQRFKEFSFPDEGIDQSKYSFLSEYRIANEIRNIFDNWDEIMGKEDLEERLITLYELVRKRAIFNFYTQSYVEDSNSADFKSRLESLLFMLTTFKKDL